MSNTKEYYHDQIEAGERGKVHKIGWLNMPGYKPETWNPIVGCSKVSPGCDNCYAEKMAMRIPYMLEKSKSETYHAYKNVIDKQGWNGRTSLNTDHIDRPLQWKSPRMIFVCSMSDLFHENVPFNWIDQVYDVIDNNIGGYEPREHLYIILTKRPERMAEYFSYRKSSHLSYGHSNVWLGVTAENQMRANERIPILMQIPAAKRFISIEPMLTQIDISFIRNSSCSGFSPLESHPISSPNKPFIDWVICGGESGSKARPCHTDWVRSIRDQCKLAGTPFFFKQWGTWCPEGTMENYSFLIPSKEKLMGKDVMTKKPIVRNHNLLDGEEYQEWPKG